MSATTRRELPPLMQLSDAAAERLRALYRGAEDGKLLRIGVKTKGCSGMAYDLGFVDAPGQGDEVVKDKGLTVLVDRKASFFLIGTTMDYEVKPMSAGFTFVNPNEKGRCGCGESFTV
ncbi:MAG TPA: iron-sulfur cluster assembly accessory protein [Roseococcus sp.]|jgi:iron-sulfur cluster assembly protein|nr:iron-sulfur cluster assembly accessory protein [Roseococcus sp.]